MKPQSVYRAESQASGTENFLPPLQLSRTQPMWRQSSTFTIFQLRDVLRGPHVPRNYIHINNRQVTSKFKKVVDRNNLHTSATSNHARNMQELYNNHLNPWSLTSQKLGNTKWHLLPPISNKNIFLSLDCLSSPRSKMCKVRFQKAEKQKMLKVGGVLLICSHG